MNQILKQISILALLTLMGISVQAQTTITSAQTGNWDVTTTWVGGVVPVAGNNVVIASTHTVTLVAATDITTGNLTVTGTLELAGFNLTAGSVAGAGNIGSASGTPTVNVGSNNSNTTYSGVLSGPCALTKSGSGTLTLTNANTYSGITNVNTGILNIQNNAALGTTAGGTVVAFGVKLQLQNNITVTGEALTLNGSLPNATQMVATGGTVTDIAVGGINYRVHTFTSSGSFDVTGGGSVEYLVVGGGGGGGGRIGGGGGAGGYRCSVSGESSGGGASAESPLTLTAGTYTAVVGSGGNGGNGVSNSATGDGSNGGDSQFDNIVATGGGGGAGTDGRNGKAGGSGGGGGRWGTTTGGTGTSNQGFGGGIGSATSANPDRSGGGGGAAAAGASGASSGNGGNGLSSSITGTSVFRAGGGGGSGYLAPAGSGGTGGGGAGQNTGVVGGNGAVNTGGGGGGGGYSGEPGFAGGNGGSGIVIVRYINGFPEALENVSGNNSWTGTVTLAADNTIKTTSGTLNVSGVISGAFALTKTGTGTLTYAGSNTYTGATTVSAGTLSIGAGSTTGAISNSSNITNNAALIVDRSDAYTYSGVISGTGTLTKQGAGIFTLSGANTYTGATTVSAGTLQLGTASERISNSSALTVASGATFDLAGFSETVGSLAGAGTVTSSAAGTLTLTAGADNTSTTFSGIVQNGSANSVALTKNGTGTLTLSGTNTYTGITNVNTGILNIQNNAALGTSAGGTVVAFGAKLQLQNNITVTGEALTLNGSSLNGNMIATGGTVTDIAVGGIGYRVHTFTSSGSFDVTIGGSLEYLVVGGGGGGGGRIGGGGGAGGYRCSVSGESSGGGGSAESPLTLTAGTYTAVVGSGGNGGNGIYNNAAGDGSNGGDSQFYNIVATGGGGGAGTDGRNGKAGGSGGGGGRVGSAIGGTGTSNQGFGGGTPTTPIPPPPPTPPSNPDRSGGGGGAAAVGDSGASSGNGGNGLSSSITGTSVFRAGGGGGSGYFTPAGSGGTGGGGAGQSTGVVGGNGAVNTGGGGGGGGYSGEPGFAGGNGGSGIVIVRYIKGLPDALENVSGDNFWTGTVTLAADNTIKTTSGTLNISGVISGAFALTKTGTGTLTYSGSNTYTGATTISAGTLSIGAGSTTGAISNSSNITNNAALIVDRSDAYTYSGVISGTGTLTKLGAGIFTLSGTNTYTGTTTISAGTLRLGANEVIPNASDVVVTGTLDMNGFNETINGIDFDGPSILVVLNSSNITVNGTVTGAGSGSYFQANGSGRVKRNINNNGGSFSFPVGNSSYNPLSITNNTNGADTFCVRVFDEVYAFGTFGPVLSNNRVKRTWDISKKTANSGSGVDFIFNWNNGEVSSTPPANYALFHHDAEGNGWGQVVIGTPSQVGNTFTFTGYTGSFSPFGIGDQNDPLPVVLISFTGECSPQGLDFKWATASEVNSKSFALEHSSNLSDWQALHTQAAAGFSSSQKTYTAQLPADKNYGPYFRLHQQDFDGKFENFPPLYLECSENTGSGLLLYPNPGQGQVQVSGFSGTLDWQIIDASGRQLRSGRLNSEGGPAALSTDGLPAGLYIFQTTTGRLPLMIKE